MGSESNNRFSIEALEPRILLSGDPVSSVVENVSSMDALMVEAGQQDSSMEDSARPVHSLPGALSFDDLGTLPSLSGAGAGEGRLGTALPQNVSGIPALVDAADAVELVLAPGRVSVDVPASGAGRTAFWKFAVPGATDVSVRIRGVSQLPTDTAIAWYDEGGNQLGVGDLAGGQTVVQEQLDLKGLEPGKLYLVAIHSSRAIPADTLRAEFVVSAPAFGRPLVMDPATGQGRLSITSQGEILGTGASIKWHALSLMNARQQATISIVPETGRNLEAVILRRIPASQQLAGSEPAYSVAVRGESTNGLAFDLKLNAPEGSNLSEEEYVVAVIPTDYLAPAAGYSLNVRAEGGLFAPVRLTNDETRIAKSFSFKPTEEYGVIEGSVLDVTSFRGLTTSGSAPTFFRLVKPYSGADMVLTVDADFSPEIAIYTSSLIQVSAGDGPGAKQIRLNFGRDNVYYLRIANGSPATPQSSGRFDLKLRVNAPGGTFGLAAPAAGAFHRSVSQSSFLVGSLVGVRTWEYVPEAGIDFLAVRLTGAGGATSRLAVQSVDGYFESSGSGAVDLIVPIRTPGARLQFLADSTLGNALFGYTTVRLPRTLGIGELPGRKLSVSTGETELTQSSFDREGDRAGFEFYQGILSAPSPQVWTAVGSGGARPLLARYMATGSELRLVDWALPDKDGKAQLGGDALSDRLYAAVAYQAFFQTNGVVKISVDQPSPVPVGVGMVPDLVYEQQNTGKFRYILQIRGVTLDRPYEEDLWETLLPDRFFPGGIFEDPAAPILEMGPDNPGGGMRLRVAVLNEDGNYFHRMDGTPVLPFTSDSNGSVRVDFATLGLRFLGQAGEDSGLQGKKIRFRVEALDGALGDGVYTLRMTVRTPNPHPHEISEKAWNHPGGVVPDSAAIPDRHTLPSGTEIRDIIQSRSGEGNTLNAFSSSAVGVHVYRFWTPDSGAFRVWTEQVGQNPANTTLKLYRARYVVSSNAERDSWWNQVDYLEELTPGVGPSTDWFPADRSSIDAQVLIQDPEFPAYKLPTNDLGDDTNTDIESQLNTPYLPRDRQFSDDQHIYFAVVKNEQGSTGAYRIHVSTEDLPLVAADPILLPVRLTGQDPRSILSVEVPKVESYGSRLAYLQVQMPSQHDGYIGVKGEEGAEWDIDAFDETGSRLSTLAPVNGEKRFRVAAETGRIYLRVEENGRITNEKSTLTIATTLMQDAELPTNLSQVGLDGTAQPMLPTNPWGEMDSEGFFAGAPVDSAGRWYRFRAPTGLLKIDVTPTEGSNVGYLWGIYDDGRLIGWKRALPNDPASHTLTLDVRAQDSADGLSGPGRNLVLVVKHSSGSVQPARFDLAVQRVGSGFGVVNAESGGLAPVPVLAIAPEPALNVNGNTVLVRNQDNFTRYQSDQWIRFVAPEGPGQVPEIVNLPDSQNVYPLRYDVYDAEGREEIASGIKAFSGAAGTIALPELVGGKAYLLRLAPRDQPLTNNLEVTLKFRPAKAAQSGGQFIHSVPMSSGRLPGGENVLPNPWGDFVTSVNLEGKSSYWIKHIVPQAGEATITVELTGSSRTHVAVYEGYNSGPDGELTGDLVDFANESSDQNSGGIKTLVLKTFLEKGLHYIEVARSNTNGGQATVEFRGPAYEVENLTLDPNQGITLRSQMGRATGTQFFSVRAPAGSIGPATFTAYDLDLLDQRPDVKANGDTVGLHFMGRLAVWTVSEGLGAVDGFSPVLVKTLNRTAGTEEQSAKATVSTLLTAPPFQKYIIGIIHDGFDGGTGNTVSERSKTVGVEVSIPVPVSGTPDLLVESIRLLPNDGQTLVEVTVLNRGYAVSLAAASKFTYPTLDASQPITALITESVLGPGTRRVHYLDWVDPTSPDDVTSYRVDVNNEVEEVDETNNSDSVALKTVSAHRPVFSAEITNGFDGNSDPSVWGRYLSSIGQNDVKVLVDITLSATDQDEALDTYDSRDDVYLIFSESPLESGSGTMAPGRLRVVERAEISRLAPGAPNIFTAYAKDRFGLRSNVVTRVIEVVPYPKWMEAGQTKVVFNKDTRRYEVDFKAKPIDYEKTLSQMLQANVPLVGNKTNQFFLEARADAEFSLNPAAPIEVIRPSVAIVATVLGQDVLNKVFTQGTNSGYVDVSGQIVVRPDTLEASDFELTTRIDQYPVDRWEGPEIPIFGFDAVVVSAAVQAQIIVDLKFDAALTFAFDLTQTNAPLRLTSPSYAGLDLRVELRFEGEVEVLGFLDIASVGGSFFFTLKPRYGLEETTGSIALTQFPAEACFSLSATVGGELSASILGFEVYSIEVESDEIQITDCVVDTQSTGALPAAPQPAPLPNDAKVRTTTRVQSGNAPTVKYDHPSSPGIIIDPVTGRQQIVYLGAPEPGARPVLYSTEGTDSGFGTPRALTSSEWMSKPILAATNDGPGLRSVVVYQAAPAPGPDGKWNSFINGQDIKYRYYDGSEWSEEITLTDNAVTDWQPAMAFNANGDGVLAWVRSGVVNSVSDAGRLVSANELVYVSRWDKANHRWGTPTSVNNNSSGAPGKISVAMANDGGYAVAWLRGTVGTRAMLLRASATNQRTLTEANAASVISGGRLADIAVAIESDGRTTLVLKGVSASVPDQTTRVWIAVRTSTFQEFQTQGTSYDLIAEAGGVSNLQLKSTGNGQIVVGWQERRGSLSDAMIARRGVDGRWTRPIRVTQSPGDERAMKFAVAGDGSVRVVFERGPRFFPTAGGPAAKGDGEALGLPAAAQGLVGSNRVSIAPELGFVGDMRFNGVQSDKGNAALAGIETLATVTLRNSGGSTANGTVEFYQLSGVAIGELGEKIGERKVRILPGGSLKLEVPVLVKSGQNKITARVKLASGNDAFSEENNVISATIQGRMDLAIENLRIVPELAGNRPQTGVPIGIAYDLVNRSGVSFKGRVQLIVFWEDPTKEAVRTVVNSGSSEIVLEPGQARALAGVFGFETAGLRILGVEIVPEQLPELSKLNNRASVPLDLRPDLAIRDVVIPLREGEVTIPGIAAKAIGDSGDAEVAVVVSNVGSAPMRGFNLQLAQSINGAAYVVGQTLAFSEALKPGEHTVVKIKAKARAGQNTYRASVSLLQADLPAGLGEPNRADNMASTTLGVQGLPDLVIQSVSFLTPGGNPPTLRIGGVATVTVAVGNLGIADAKGVVVEVFGRSLTTVGGGSNVLLGSAVIQTVGASATVNIALNTSLLQEGMTYIEVVADRHQRILEKSDLNNRFERAIRVAPPTFVATATVVGSKAGQWSIVDSFSVTFSQNFNAPVNAGILRLENVTTGEIIDASKLAMTVNPATRTITWKFTGFADGRLPEGEYMARIAAGAFADRSNNALGRTVATRFSVTRGDASGDGITNEKDYLLVWRELRKAEGARSARADVNGDGVVNQADLDVVRGSHGRRGALVGGTVP